MIIIIIIIICIYIHTSYIDRECLILDASKIDKRLHGGVEHAGGILKTIWRCTKQACKHTSITAVGLFVNNALHTRIQSTPSPLPARSSARSGAGSRAAAQQSCRRRISRARTWLLRIVQKTYCFLFRFIRLNSCCV